MTPSDPPVCEEFNQRFQTHLKEFVPMAAEQSVGLGLILAVQSIHSKLILLHTRLTGYTVSMVRSRNFSTLCKT